MKVETRLNLALLFDFNVMADPLNSLRASINSSTPPKPADANSAPVESLAAASHITLSGIVLPKDTVTRFRKSTSSPATDGYTLAALYTVWHLRDAAAAEYMRQTREAGVTSFVSITERKGVVDWLEGRKTEDERIAPLTTAGGAYSMSCRVMRVLNVMQTPRRHLVLRLLLSPP